MTAELTDEQVAWIRGCCMARLRKNEKEQKKLRAKTDQPKERFLDFLGRRAEAIAFARATIEVLTAELERRGRDDLLEPLPRAQAPS